LDARPAAGEGVASGDVVNTAARLQTAAPVDGVLVGELTYRATRDVIEYVEEEPISAKGKADPVACWRVLGARSRVGERRARQETPLVDRVRERAALLNAFERSRDGRSVEVCTLIGVPGIGKSRLVWELSEHIASMPDIIRWRHGRSPAYGHGAAFPA